MTFLRKWLIFIGMAAVNALDCPQGDNGIFHKYKVAQEGSSLTMTCFFLVSADCGPISWEWDPDQPIVPSSRIQIHDVTNSTGLYSSLYINPVSRRDAGWKFCFVRSGAAFSTELFVNPLPVLEMTPLFKAAEEGTNVIITCKITNYYSRIHPVTFKWCRGSNLIPNNAHHDVNGISTLHLVSVTFEDSGEYRCGLQGYDGECSNMTHVMRLEVYSKTGTTFCKEEIDINTGLTWTSTPAGTTTTQPCGLPSYTGTTRRVCGVDGVWGVPVTIECVRQEISSALDDLIYLETTPGNTETVLENVISGISNVTDTVTLTSGDLKTTTAVLEKIVNIITETTENVSVSEKKFVGIIDDILSGEYKNAWTEVNDQSLDPIVGHLMKIVEGFGSAVGPSLTIDRPIVVNGDNLDLKFSRLNVTSPKITFYPEKTINGSDVGVSLNPDSVLEGNITYTAVYYRTISNLLPQSENHHGHPEVASEVIALSIGSQKDMRHLTSPVILTFDTEKLKQTNNLSGDLRTRCVFWDFETKQSPAWSSDGCRLVNDSCHCDHLTNFAVLMSPILVLDDLVLISLEKISIIGCSISVAGTVLTILTYLVLWRHVKNDRGRLLLNLCVALTAAYVLFLTGIDRTENDALCTTVAALLHYFFLATFCLMLAEGIMLLMSVTVVFYSKSKLKLLLIMGWGVPAVIVGITIWITHGEEYHSQYHCWLTISNGVLYSFVGPAVTIIIINTAIIFRVQKAIYSSHFIVTKTQRQKILTGVRSVSILLPVLGVTWLFGILAVNADFILFQYVFAIANSLQGFFIFLSYCVFSGPVQRAIKRKIKMLTLSAFSSKDDNKLQIIKTKPTHFSAQKNGG
ncbi:adhesion G protein-coupled receptor L4-like isoform X2 [Argopecten irradians]|uniref:adhesion G protein-coupled receptor L4-like isoform X2 n=1 Tax=Argopecten irradians TaxID=31199 RepID=UPI00371513AA